MSKINKFILKDNKLSGILGETLFSAAFTICKLLLIIYCWIFLVKGRVIISHLPGTTIGKKIDVGGFLLTQS